MFWGFFFFFGFLCCQNILHFKYFIFINTFILLKVPFIFWNRNIGLLTTVNILISGDYILTDFDKELRVKFYRLTDKVLGVKLYF